MAEYICILCICNVGGRVLPSRNVNIVGVSTIGACSEQIYE